MPSAISRAQNLPPELFKGIALFTPGGDLVYCIDPQKHNRWHLQLCAVLQELLGLTEPPHFLVPCYTATLDRWLDPATQTLRTSAEAYPLVLRHQAVLNAVFGREDLPWTAIAPRQEVCDPLVLQAYQSRFPQLWESHDLIVRFEPAHSATPLSKSHVPSLSWNPPPSVLSTQGYVLRLYVSGNSAVTEQTLHNLHRLLENTIQHPYTLKVIDVYKNPEQAEQDHISATPTLVRVWPRPVRRIVGGLNNPDQLLAIADF